MHIQHPKLTILPEWAPQQAILIIWPNQQSDWGTMLPAIEEFYLNLTAIITADEQLIIIVQSLTHQEHVVQQLKDAAINLANVQTVIFPTNDTWARDIAPLSTLNAAQQLVFANLQFNGWGGKYAHKLDNSLNEKLATTLWQQHPMQDIDLIIEGGNLDVNGAGTLLTQEGCLLNANRHQLSKDDFIHKLEQYFDISQIIALKHGFLIGDDTDGHIDNLARFCNPTTIAYLSCTDQNDPHYETLFLMQQELLAYQEQFTLIPIPMPQAKFSATSKKRLPASYLNFLITNNCVIYPVFDDPHDKIAKQQLAKAFKERRIIGLNTLAPIEQGGGIHCLTMQIAGKD